MNKSTRNFFVLALLVLGLVVLSGQVLAQQSARLAIEQVESSLFPEVDVYLSVSDVQGFPVKGLIKENFSVSEDGQSVTNFEISSVQNIQQPLAFVLLIDTSGSMAWGDTPTPLENAIAAAKSFVDTLSTQDQVAIVTFSSQIEVVQELTAERSSTNTALNSLVAAGDTALYDGLVEAISQLKDVPDRKVVLLITDGIESGISEYTFDQAVNEAVRWSIPIYPIGFGAVDEQQLSQLADLSGGYVQVEPDSTTLQTSLNTVQEILREQYLLQFQSSLPADGLEHTLSVVVDYPNHNLEVSKSFVAQPNDVTVTLPDFLEGQMIGGKIRLAPEIISPADVSSLQISIDGELLDSVLSEPFEYNWDAGTVLDGLHKFDFIVHDSAGNVGEFSINLNVQPAVSVKIDTPVDGDDLSVTTTISATVTSQAAMAKVEFFVDDQLIDTRETALFETDWLVEDEELGVHVIKVVASDAAGNQAVDQVTVDVVVPISVSFIDLEDGDLLRGSPDIAVQVDAQFEVADVVIMADDKELGSFSAPPYVVEWPLYNVDPGQYVISAKASDVDGHTAQAEVTVDVNRAGVASGYESSEEGGSVGAGSAEIGSGDSMGIWIAVITALVLTGVLIPLALRKRKDSDGPASRASSAVLHELLGNTPGQTWPLSAAEIKLGRKRDVNDIHLKGRSASRQMAVIRADQAGHTIYSLSPNNPVVINGTPIAQQQILKNGDLIQLGESQFRYEG